MSGKQSTDDQSRLRLLQLGFLVATACLLVALLPSQASAAFGLKSFDGSVERADGTAANRGGEHPFQVETEFHINSTTDPVFGFPTPEGMLRNVEVDLPAGFIGDPTEMPTCSQAAFTSGSGTYPDCSDNAQVGLAGVQLASGMLWAAVYNMDPPPNYPAQFAFKMVGVPVYLNAFVRTDGDYGVTVRSRNISQSLAVMGTKMIFWGVPASSAHDGLRGSCIDDGVASPEPVPDGSLCPAGVPARPFLTNPTDCSTGPLRTHLRVESWEGVRDSAYFDSHLPAPDQDTLVGPVECGDLPFDPTLDVQPSHRRAGVPAGYRIELGIPQSNSVTARAASTLEDAVVTLPEGVAVNPASAGGLRGCSPEEVGLVSTAPIRFNTAAVACPDESKLGSVEVETPLLPVPMTGSVYLGAQGDNAFGSLLALYIVMEARGVRVKLAGKVELDPVSGRLTTTFNDNPQLAFETLTMRLKDGPRAALINPERCGVYAATSSLTPHSAFPEPPSARVADPQLVRHPSGSFAIDRAADGGPCRAADPFVPQLTAGTANPLAGTHSPFALRFTRADGTQQISTLTTVLPKGLLGKLAGIPYCPDVALANVSGAEGSGAGQLATPSCPAASQVGTVTAGAGAGPNPFYVDTGRAYLAGPYKGAPLSLAFITPAVAGPLDLGSVVVRAALRVNPVSAEITAVSDPLPSILHGIPLNLRDVRVNLNRPQFTINPTSCNPLAFTGGATSILGASAPLAEHFQVAGCEGLLFKPRLALRFVGATARGKHPQLRATLTAAPGQANIGKAVVTMPKTELLENAHIRTICTRDQWAADACPAGAIYGHARAFSPLLDQPLEGPVYLRANGGARQLPDLVADLKGQIDVELVGYIDAVNARLRARFVNVPDAPVSKFVLNMQGGKKGLLVHNTNVCKTKPRASVKFDGQNGKLHDFNPVVKTSCGKVRKSSGAKQR